MRDGKDLELSSVTLNLDKPNQGDILDSWQWMLVKHNCYMSPDQFGYIKASHFGFVLPVMEQPNLLYHLEGVTHLYFDFFPQMLNLYNSSKRS